MHFTSIIRKYKLYHGMFLTLVKLPFTGNTNAVHPIAIDPEAMPDVCL